MQNAKVQPIGQHANLAHRNVPLLHTHNCVPKKHMCNVLKSGTIIKHN